MIYKIPENATILSIKEDTIKDDSRGWDELYEGLIIETDKGDIRLVISTGQSCCENWGSLFFETTDDVSDLKFNNKQKEFFGL
jgi:hypothetical protein